MKKWIISLALAITLLLPLGTIAIAGIESVPPAPHSEYQSGDVPAHSDLASMAPAIHAVLLAMDNQGADTYPAADSETAWEMLYNLLSMYGQLDSRACYEDEMLLLPAETVADYSSALFAAPLSPDTLPDSLSDRMVYDPQFDEYRLYCGSDELAEVRLDAPQELDGQLTVSGSLIYLAEEESLADFTAHLALSENMFGYTLVGLEIV